MKITLNRVLLFLTLVLLAGLVLQQCWQRRTEAQKWLYLFEEPARDYAGRVLGPERGTGLEPPDSLSEMSVSVDHADRYVLFSSDMFSPDDGAMLHMAFAPDGPPPAPEDSPGHHWVRVRDGWYQLRPAP